MGQMARGSTLGGSEIFRTRPDWPWVPPSLLYNGYRVFPGSKAAWASFHHPPPSRVMLKKENSYTSTPPLGLHGLFQGNFTYTFYLFRDSLQRLPVINEKTSLYFSMTFVFHSCCFQYVHLCTCNIFTYRTVNMLNLYTVVAFLRFCRYHRWLNQQNMLFSSAKFQSKIIFSFLTHVKDRAFLHDTFTHTHTHTRCTHNST